MKNKKTMIGLIIIAIILIGGNSIISGARHISAEKNEKITKVDKKAISRASSFADQLNNDSKKSDFSKATKMANKIKNKKSRKEIKKSIAENKKYWIADKKPIKKEAALTDSSQRNKQSKNKKFLNHLNNLNKGTAQYAKFNVKTNTVTWTGYDNWTSLSHSDLKKSMDILETITNKSAIKFNIYNPTVIVKTPNGTEIAKASDGENLRFVK